MNRRPRGLPISTVTMTKTEADALDAVVEAARAVVSGSPAPGGGRLILEVHVERLEKALAVLSR